MKGFVDAVHDEGMKFLLWYSVPFMGKKAKNYPAFKGKHLWHWASQKTYVMDPRYPEVRAYIVNTYVKALNDCGLDGFKFDFIGWFTASKDTKLTNENGRDYASVNEATDALMTEITTRLRELKADVLIEFRQPYIGPVMRKYGNMFRGVDAPNNAVANKIEVTNLRILAQNTAVHSDMFIWRSEETIEQAALQILNILYSVPQLSVRLGEIPETHLAMIRHWFNYWNANRDVLLDGDFMPSDPRGNYPSLTAIKAGHQITTVYQDVIVVAVNDFDRLDIINAKPTLTIGLQLEHQFDGFLTITNTSGKVLFEKEVSLPKGINNIKIPKSGLASFKRVSKSS
jgi:alpha-galactosidase